MISMHGSPIEWKRRQQRVRCSACGSEFWTSGHPIGQHNRPDGRTCRASIDPRNPAGLSRESLRILNES
jgi:hypothetical protein